MSRVSSVYVYRSLGARIRLALPSVSTGWWRQPVRNSYELRLSGERATYPTLPYPAQREQSRAERLKLAGMQARCTVAHTAVTGELQLTMVQAITMVRMIMTLQRRS